MTLPHPIDIPLIYFVTEREFCYIQSDSFLC